MRFTKVLEGRAFKRRESEMPGVGVAGEDELHRVVTESTVTIVKNRVHRAILALLHRNQGEQSLATEATEADEVGRAAGFG